MSEKEFRGGLGAAICFFAGMLAMKGVHLIVPTGALLAGAFIIRNALHRET